MKKIIVDSELARAASKYAYDDDCILASGRMGASVKEAFADGASWQRNRVWHSISEKADSSKFVIFYDGGQYMSPPSRCPLSFETFVIAMNKKYGANYTMWAYMDDIVPKEILKFSNS